MINAIYNVVLLLVANGFSFATNGEDSTGAIRCQIGGVTNNFWVDARAVYTPLAGLQIFASTDTTSMSASLIMTIPSPRVGDMSLRSVTNLALSYSRSCLSSSLADNYEASRNIPGTRFDVRIEKLGAIGEKVEGRFSGLVANGFGPLLSITNGFFSLRLSGAVATLQGSNGTQPSDPHEPCEGPRSPR